MGSFLSVEISVTTVLITAIAVVAAVLYLRWQEKMKNAIKIGGGVKPTFLIGNLNEFTRGVMEAVDYLAIEKRDSTTKLSHLWKWDLQVLLVSDREHIRQVLRSSNFRAFTKLGVHTRNFLGQEALVMKMGKEWEIHRRLTMSPFNTPNLRWMMDEVVDCSNQLVARIRRNGLTTDEKNPVIVDVLDLLKRVTLDVIGRTTINHRFEMCNNDGANKFGDAFSWLIAEMARRIYSIDPFLQFYWLPTPSNFKQKMYRKYVTGFLDGVVEQRKADRAARKDEPNDMLKAMLDLMEEGVDQVKYPGLEFGEKALSDELLTMMFAGHDTTSIMLTYTLYLLSSHPEIVKRAREEIEQKVGDRAVTYADVTELHYIKCILREALRLYPSSPMTTRTLVEDLTLSGVHIPAGTEVWIPIWSIHRLPEYWEYPLKFNPSRFEDHKDKYTDLAFGSGPRDCIGRTFAMAEGTCILVTLLKEFDFKVREGYEVKPTAQGVVQMPKGGMPMIITERALAHDCPSG